PCRRCLCHRRPPSLPARRSPAPTPPARPRSSRRRSPPAAPASSRSSNAASKGSRPPPRSGVLPPVIGALPPAVSATPSVVGVMARIVDARARIVGALPPVTGCRAAPLRGRPPASRRPPFSCIVPPRPTVHFTMRIRATHAVCLSVALLGFALSLYKVHFPPGPVADEAAYAMMTESRWHDHDLTYDHHDLFRAY